MASHTRALCISNALAPSGISSVWQNVTLEVHLDMEGIDGEQQPVEEV